MSYLTAVTLYVCNMKIANSSAADSAHHGQNQEKEKLQLHPFFSTENEKSYGYFADA